MFGRKERTQLDIEDMFRYLRYANDRINVLAEHLGLVVEWEPAQTEGRFVAREIKKTKGG